MAVVELPGNKWEVENNKQASQISPNAIRWSLVKFSPKIKMAITMFRDGPMYWRNPIKDRGSCLIALEKKNKGEMVMNPAPISNSIMVVFDCKKAEVPFDSNNVKKKVATGKIKAVSKNSPKNGSTGMNFFTRP